jgi:hypothetical protein
MRSNERRDWDLFPALRSSSEKRTSSTSSGSSHPLRGKSGREEAREERAGEGIASREELAAAATPEATDQRGRGVAMLHTASARLLAPGPLLATGIGSATRSESAESLRKRRISSGRLLSATENRVILEGA